MNIFPFLKSLIGRAILILPLLSFGISGAQEFNVKPFNLPVNVSIRAISSVSDSVVWFSGNRGIFGFTDDGGVTWKIDSVRVDTNKFDFRSLAVLNDSTVIMINAGSPARIFKTTDKGKNWRIVYANDSKEIFFDAVRFDDEKFGYALADPINKCFVIMRTTDGGETWKEADCYRWLHSLDGEASFAASNSSLEVVNHKIWFVTGGMYCRIFFSGDYGNSWEVRPLPIMSGEQMTGPFTIDFYDEQNGIAAGGHYDKKQLKDSTIAVTSDGGQSWKLLHTNDFGFTSCVQYMPGSKGKKILFASDNVYMTSDYGRKFSKVADGSYFTFRFSPSGKVAWFAGSGGRILKLTATK